ncbi:MAG: gamma-glutamyl-gamma-aminobutyrate hydrolase family protein [Acidobacteriota bacterium]|nr:gamma-glutamyl-gamma-aminobutyrate hydrolase family protein [Acidobacteriota bacterium]
MQETEAAGLDSQNRPRIGIPFRLASEEQAGNREKIEPYARAVELAGGEPRPLSLFLTEEQLKQQASELDGIVLPGSPADVNPARYGETSRAETAEPDERREQTDLVLLDWAFAEGKPVLAICYGTQLLNVYRGGTLVQDIPSELRGSLTHKWERERGMPEPHHPARLLAGSVVSRLGETAETVVNSSHHQSIRMPGRNLRVTAISPDGVIEAVELESRAHWVVGAQWHPERQRNESSSEGDSGVRLARALFRDLVRSARESRDTGRGSESVAGAQNEAEGR